jgi:hypothetical protein
MDENIIEEAKRYARTHETSLSQLIARYLRSLTHAKKARGPISPIVQEISGVLPHSFRIGSPMKGYRRHLRKKYQ